MSDTTNDKNIKEKLTYLNLDLEKIPEFLLKYQPLDFRVSNSLDDKVQAIYKHVPINKIQIYITSATRSGDLRTKYTESLPMYRYLDIKNGEEMDKYTAFLNMLNNMDIEELETIETKQDSLSQAIPFRVKYDRSYLWQIYYSTVNDIYFMIVSIDDMECNSLFYILKKQIEFNNSKSKVSPKIYVPITHLDYSRDILTRTELKDIENYLWLLTGDWAKIYEVFDKRNNSTIHILGETKVYDNIKTEYKVKLANKEEARDFYKLIKALFILKTELNHYYKFEVKIDKESNLEFSYNHEPLNLETLPTFIKKEYKKITDELVRKNLSSNHLEQVLNNMKSDMYNKEREFINKEKEISTFLEYKKTFFGKIKIFFSKKTKKAKEHTLIEQTQDVIVNSVDMLEHLIQKKANYTIEDLVVIYSVCDKKTKHVKNLQMDIEALEYKIKNLERRIENAILYIKEIEQHKKSIFEFWRFANKDEMPALAPGEEVTTKKKLSKIFNYEFDFEDLGNMLDKNQRKKLNKEEINSLFLVKSNILDAINIIRKKNIENGDEKQLKNILEQLKKDMENDEVGEARYDIFGSMLDDNTQIKTIANKHHREVEKSRFQILNISKHTTLEEFIEELQEIDKNILSAMEKIDFLYNMSIYKITDNILNGEGLAIFTIDAETCIKNNKFKEVNLYKLNVKEGQKALFYTNIIFYENTNKTLPLGMNLSNDVLLDMDNIVAKLVTKKTFMTNSYYENEEDAVKMKLTKVNVYEYEV